LYDTAPDNDYLNMERIGKNLESLDKAEKDRAIKDMRSQQLLESKKSIIGRINAEELRGKDSTGKDRLEEAQRENHVSQALFSLDPSQFRLKKADWLEYVSMEGTVSETIKR